LLVQSSPDQPASHTHLPSFFFPCPLQTDVLGFLSIKYAATPPAAMSRNIIPKIGTAPLNLYDLFFIIYYNIINYLFFTRQIICDDFKFMNTV
jgi:hypothetical protein